MTQERSLLRSWIGHKRKPDNVAKETITCTNLSSVLSYNLDTLIIFWIFKREKGYPISGSLSSCYIGTAKSKVLLEHFYSILFQHAEGSSWISTHNLTLIASAFERQEEWRRVSWHHSFYLLSLETLPYGLSIRLARPGSFII